MGSEPDIFIPFIIMTAAGLLGGSMNYLQAHNNNGRGMKKYLAAVIAGMAASYLVPAFLNMLSSNLLQKSKDDIGSLFIFFGLCLVAAILSRHYRGTGEN